MKKEELIEALKSYTWSEEAICLGLRARFRCEYCDRDLLASVDDYDSWQVDHIIPTSKGGQEDFENKAVSCKTCNFIKRNWMPSQHSKDRYKNIETARVYIQEKRADKLKVISEVRKLVFNLIYRVDRSL